MTANIHFAVALALAMVVRPGSGWAQPGERAVYVSVLDQGGMPVSGLATGDFIVREGGTDRDVLRVSTATDPMQIAVLVDTGQAMEPYVSEVRSALRSFSREIQDRHVRALFAFGDRPAIVSDYSRDPIRLEKGIARLFERTGDGASVADAIIEVSRGLRQRAATRPVVVLITAEGPDLGERDHQSVLDHLRETSATLHTFFLDRAGALPGNAGASMALDRRLQQLAAELNNQYLVIYAQPGTALGSDPVDVTVKRSGLTVRTPFAPRKPRATCGIVETNTSRDQAFFGYQCR
jgi:hypothetical protein